MPCLHPALQTGNWQFRPDHILRPALLVLQLNKTKAKFSNKPNLDINYF